MKPKRLASNSILQTPLCLYSSENYTMRDRQFQSSTRSVRPSCVNRTKYWQGYLVTRGKYLGREVVAEVRYCDKYLYRACNLQDKEKISCRLRFSKFSNTLPRAMIPLKIFTVSHLSSLST